MSNHAVFSHNLTRIYMGQYLFSTFFFPQGYSQWKAWYINLSTDLPTISTGKKVFIHITQWKTYHYIL